MMRYFLLCALAWALSAPAAAAGLDQLKSFLATAKSARGVFAQTVLSKSGKKPQQAGGIFALERPGKFRWSYEKPYKQLLVSDGDKLWSYDSDLNQVAIRKLGKALGSSPAALLAGNALEQSFTLTDAGSNDGLEYVEARPKAGDASFEKVKIGLVGNLPVVMEIYDAFGQVTLLRFTQFEINPPLAAGLFRFTPPKGADVVGE